MTQTTLSKKQPKKSGTQTILWWIAWIVLTIVSFFIAAAVWTPIIAHHFGSIRETKAAVWWVGSVFSTWMVILVPLIIVMYQKVDKAYEDARNKREKAAMRFRSIHIESSKRELNPEVSKKLASLSETIEGGHLITAILKDGRRISNVFISDHKEITGIYDASELTFEGRDVVGIEPVNWEQPPHFLAMNWLRLDGVTAPE